MDVDEMLTQLREELRDNVTGNQKWNDGRLIQDLNDSQIDVALIVGGIEAQIDLSIAASQQWISLPSDFLMSPTSNLFVRYKVETNVYRPLRARSYAWLKTKSMNLSTGNPTFFAIWADKLWLDTIKSSAETDAIDFNYYKKAATLASGGTSEFDEIFHRLIVLHAAKTRARREREYELSRDIDDLYEIQFDRITMCTGPLGGTQMTGEFSETDTKYDYEVI